MAERWTISLDLAANLLYTLMLVLELFPHRSWFSPSDQHWHGDTTPGSGWSLPSSLSPPLHWRRNILDYHGQSPLVEGQLGFPLERQEIMASLGGEKCGKYMGGLFTIVSALEA